MEQLTLAHMAGWLFLAAPFIAVIIMAGKTIGWKGTLTVVATTAAIVFSIGLGLYLLGKL